jgi:DNA gyrase subunit B
VLARKIVPAPAAVPPVRGTRVTFVPDPEIFAPAEIPHGQVVETMRGACAILRDLEITITQAPVTLTGERGLLALLRTDTAIAPPFVFRERCEETLIDLVASWGKWPGHIKSFANLQPTTEHGSHVDGFRQALKQALGAAPAHVDRLSLVISVDRDAITYSGPMKGRLGTPEIAGIVERALTAPLTAYLNGPGQSVKALLLPVER